MTTAYKWINASWKVPRRIFKELDINPEKDYELLFLKELDWLADHLEVTTYELIKYT